MRLISSARTSLSAKRAMFRSYCNLFSRFLQGAPALNRDFLRLFKRILTRAQFNPQRRADQRKRIAEMLLQITLVRIAHRFQRIAVDDDDRRVHAALVRIAQLRTDRALAARLLLLHGLDRARVSFGVDRSAMA